NKKNKKFRYYKSIKEIKNIESFDTIFFAVKPQIIDDVIKDYKILFNKKKLIISIVAGINIRYFEDFFGSNSPIVRTMPNLPASVGKGVSCLCSNRNVSKKHKGYIDKLFKSVGKSFWIKSEKTVDKITAISGSGPAYFYYFIEGLERAGLKLGLNRELSRELSKHTAFGAIDLMEKSNAEAMYMRKKIAITGGTTEAAIKKLKLNNKLHNTILQGVQAAYRRAVQIGKKKKKTK
ncbi:MAG: hypothetical protein CFH21_01161, partial [Alphaproteobacteria bacterium MarineAlpha5_Bin11]